MADLQRLLSRGGLIMGMRLAGAAITLVTQIAIARYFGTIVLGEYIVALAILNLAAMVLPLGFQSVSSYFTAEYRAQSQGNLLRAFRRRAHCHVLAMALLFAACGLALPYLGSDLQWLRAIWLPLAILASAVASVYLSGSTLNALKFPLAGFAADTFLRPVAIAIGVSFALICAGSTSVLATMMWAAAGFYGAVAFWHYALANSQAAKIEAGSAIPKSEAARWWRFAIPWTLVAIATDFFFDIDLLLLASLLGKQDLAVFGVATRMFLLAAFGISAIYAVYMPDIFEAMAHGNRAAIAKKISNANLASICAALLAVPMIYFAAPWVMQVFGKDFDGGATALAWLSLALVIRAVLGPASLVLSMHDHPYASLPAIAAGFAVLLGCNWLLVPLWGMTGAAVSADAAILAWAVLQWWTAYSLTGTDVSAFAAMHQRSNSRAMAQSLTRPDSPTDTGPG